MEEGKRGPRTDSRDAVSNDALKGPQERRQQKLEISHMKRVNFQGPVLSDTLVCFVCVADLQAVNKKVECFPGLDPPTIGSNLSHAAAQIRSSRIRVGIRLVSIGDCEERESGSLVQKDVLVLQMFDPSCG